MIKTREDWEHVKTVAELQSGPSLQHAVDTIEVLREAGSYAIHDEACAIEGKGTDEIDAEFCTCGYVKAVVALPDWIKKEKRWLIS